jgi:hypothetical protein
MRSKKTLTSIVKETPILGPSVLKILYISFSKSVSKRITWNETDIYLLGTPKIKALTALIQTPCLLSLNLLQNEKYSTYFIPKLYLCKLYKVVKWPKRTIISSLGTIRYPNTPSYWIYKGQIRLNDRQNHRQFSLYNGTNDQHNRYSMPKITTPTTELRMHGLLSPVTSSLGYSTYAYIQPYIFYFWKLSTWVPEYFVSKNNFF